jgi:hypothetical protein
VTVVGGSVIVIVVVDVKVVVSRVDTDVVALATMEDQTT